MISQGQSESLGGNNADLKRGDVVLFSGFPNWVGIFAERKKELTWKHRWDKRMQRAGGAVERVPESQCLIAPLVWSC